jgi:hypothetical protein
LRYASFTMWQFHNRIRSLWLGGWWWSLEILRATKFGKQIFVGLSGDKGREHLIISKPLNARCLFVFGGVLSMGLVRAMGCICQIYGKPIYTLNHCQVFSCNIFYRSQDLFSRLGILRFSYYVGWWESVKMDPFDLPNIVNGSSWKKD